MTWSGRGCPVYLLLLPGRMTGGVYSVTQVVTGVSPGEALAAHLRVPERAGAGAGAGDGDGDGDERAAGFPSS